MNCKKGLRIVFIAEEFIDKRVEAKRLTSALLTGVEIGEGALLFTKLFIFWTERERKGGLAWHLIHMKLDRSQRTSEQLFLM